MGLIGYRGTAAIAVTVLGAGAAQADVTAQEVWDNWKATLESSGAGVVTFDSEDMSGDTLTVSGLTLDIEDPEASVTAELGELAFVEQGDGTVRVELPQEVPVAVDTLTEDGTTVTLTLSVRQEGAEVEVSGSPEEMTYDIGAERYVIGLDPVENLDGADINAGSLEVAGIEGTYTVATDEMREVDYEASAETVTISADVEQTDGSGLFKMLATVEDLGVTADITSPLEIDEENAESVFVDGLSFDVRYESGATDYSFTATDEEGTVEGSGGTESGSLEVAMDSEGFTYSGGAEAPIVSLSGSKMPMPVDASMQDYSYNLNLPLSTSEEPRDFSLQLALNELSVNDEVWSTVDPAGQLPHDPATVNLDLSGTAKLYFDVLDPEQAQAMMMSDMPAELHSLSLNDLTVRIAGAELTGEGAFTFDNEDLETFEGFPAPDGSVTLKAEGLNGLIDTLSDMGLLPQEQVMGARMMMGMFARSTGDDQLESTLEVNGEGQIIANGQRIR